MTHVEAAETMGHSPLVPGTGLQGVAHCGTVVPHIPGGCGASSHGRSTMFMKAEPFFEVFSLPPSRVGYEVCRANFMVALELKAQLPWGPGVQVNTSGD